LFNVSMNMPSTPIVDVSTTSGRGHSPEEVADLCIKRLISVSDNVDPVLRDQALAYREQMRDVVTRYIKMAILSDRTTVYNKLKELGQEELAQFIRNI